MKPAKTLFQSTLLMILLGSHPALAVDSESLGDELKKLKKTATAEQPTVPVTASEGKDTTTASTNTTLASGK